MKNPTNPFFLSILGGVCAGLPFMFSTLWPLALVAFVPLLLALADKGTDRKHAFLYGFLFGFIVSGCAVSWLWQTLPLDWLVERSWQGIALATESWVLTTLVLALPAGLFTLAVHWLGIGRSVQMIAIPFFWVIAEIARMWAYAILTLAPNSLFAPHFSAGALGYPLVQSPFLLQIADPGGILSLSFFVALAGTALFLPSLGKSLSRHIVFDVMAVLIILCLFSAHPHTPSEEARQVSVAALTTYTPLRPGDLEERFAKYRSLLEEAVQNPSEPALIVFSEGYGLETLFPEKEALDSFMHATFQDRSSLIVSSAREETPRGHVIDMLFYDTRDGEVARSPKIFLAPQGESIPYLTRGLAYILTSAKLSGNIARKEDLERGERPLTGTSGDITVGALFCSEIVSPFLYRDMVREQKPDILANLASHAWFHDSRILHGQVLWFAKVHAVQNRRPFILAGNGTPSFVLDANGAVIAQMPWGEEGVLFAEVEVEK